MSTLSCEQGISDLLNLNPLDENAYQKYVDNSSNKSAARAAQGVLRSRLLRTIGDPLTVALTVVCARDLPPAPDVEHKLAVLRHYIRTHQLHLGNGHKHRPFWGKIDEYYVELKETLGACFRCVGWADFLKRIKKDDELFAPPQVEKPLLTHTPLVSKLCWILNQRE